MTTDALPPSETAARAEKRHPILQLLAQNVRGGRTAFGWSMKAAVTPGTIKNIETFRANPGLSILFRLSNGFGLTFSDLIDPTLLARLPKEPVSLVRYSDPEALSAAVGPKIVLSRRRRKLGRAKFAKISGVSKSMLLYVESGRMEPSLTTLVHIADGLNLPLAQLVEGNESPIPPPARVGTRCAPCRSTARLRSSATSIPAG